MGEHPEGGVKRVEAADLAAGMLAEHDRGPRDDMAPRGGGDQRLGLGLARLVAVGEPFGRQRIVLEDRAVPSAADIGGADVEHRQICARGQRQHRRGARDVDRVVPGCVQIEARRRGAVHDQIVRVRDRGRRAVAQAKAVRGEVDPHAPCEGDAFAIVTLDRRVGVDRKRRDRVTARHQPPRDLAADEATGAGQEDVHGTRGRALLAQPQVLLLRSPYDGA